MNDRKNEITDIIKEKIFTALDFLCMVLIMFILLAITGYNETHYNRNGIIVDKEDNGNIYIKDDNGKIWTFNNTNFNVDDKVVLKMHTNYTDNTISDDKIIKILKENH